MPVITAINMATVLDIRLKKATRVYKEGVGMHLHQSQQHHHTYHHAVLLFPVNILIYNLISLFCAIMLNKSIVFQHHKSNKAIDFDVELSWAYMYSLPLLICSRPDGAIGRAHASVSGRPGFNPRSGLPPTVFKPALAIWYPLLPC